MNVQHEHPAYSDLSGYVLDELGEERIADVEEHLLICERCRQTVSELDVFVPVIHSGSVTRVAAGFRHASEDGCACFELRRLPDHKWGARYSRKDIPQSGVFPSAAQAHAFLRERFELDFPEHLCTERCGPASS